MLLTEEEASIVNARRLRINNEKSETMRLAKRILIAQCKFLAGKYADRQCPMKASKEGYCGQHYNKVHGLKQWAE